MTKDTKNNGSIAVLMLMGTQCTYCDAMMQALTALLKNGEFAQLKIVNIEQDMQLASQLGVRSVPWLQIGSFELSGSRTRQELQQWIKRASSVSGLTEYLKEVLSEGDIARAKKLIKNEDKALQSVIHLMADTGAKINIRLGVGVLIEELAEHDVFKPVIPLLIDYLSHSDARVRGDACHYLSLTKDISLLPVIEKLLADESDEVKEIAADSIEDLNLLIESLSVENGREQ